LRGPSEHQVVGVMIAGIPVQYGDKYLASNFKPFSDEVYSYKDNLYKIHAELSIFIHMYAKLFVFKIFPFSATHDVVS
jgi:hypothetical protein